MLLDDFVEYDVARIGKVCDEFGGFNVGSSCLRLGRHDSFTAKIVPAESLRQPIEEVQEE